MKKNLSYFLLEGLLIIFSVLLALFLNKWWEDVQMEQREEVAIENIITELKNNRELIQRSNGRHKKIFQKLQKCLKDKSDTLRNELFQDGLFNVGYLTEGEYLFEALPSNTAWESAKSTRIISRFDYDLVNTLTEVYTFQSVVMNETRTDISETYFARESHRPDQLDATLRQFWLLFQELTGQENILLQAYEDAIHQAEHNLNY